MFQGISRWVVVVMMMSAAVVPIAAAAEESSRTLPTLLIKGELVSVDANDPEATLVKIKDRYGFETPIYLMADTTITQGDQTLTVAQLSAGTAISIEYNFDINTAKRHATSVTVAVPAPAADASPVVPPTPMAAQEPAATEVPATPEPVSATAPAPPAAPEASVAPAQADEATQ